MQCQPSAQEGNPHPALRALGVERLRKKHGTSYSFKLSADLLIECNNLYRDMRMTYLKRPLSTDGQSFSTDYWGGGVN
jgi:hypothetical protein